MNQTPLIPLTFRLPRPLVARLQAAAQEEGTSRYRLGRLLLMDALSGLPPAAPDPETVEA